jgi:hypothetical protein
MKTVEEAWRSSGPRRWQCSEERHVAPTCPASRGRILGEEGLSQSRVEGLGAALTGGGGQRCGLDEIRHGGRVLATGNQLNEPVRRQGGFGPSVRCSQEKGMAGTSVSFRGHATLREKRGGDGAGSVRAAPRGGRRRGSSGSVAPAGARGQHGRAAVGPTWQHT